MSIIVFWSFYVFNITLAKFLFGLGLGILVTTYWPTVAWNPYGWLAIVIALALGPCAASRIYKKSYSSIIC